MLGVGSQLRADEAIIITVNEPSKERVETGAIKENGHGVPLTEQSLRLSDERTMEFNPMLAQGAFAFPNQQDAIMAIN